MRTADFDYPLPPELIAQEPAAQRDQSRLLVLNRATLQIAHRSFKNLLEYLSPGDVLVLNDSKVIPARLHGAKKDSGGHVEMLLLEENQLNDWWLMLRPGKRIRPGTRLVIVKLNNQPAGIEAVVLEKNAEGHCRVRFSGVDNVRDSLEAIGLAPLPPYIHRETPNAQLHDRERYQTVYAQHPGSVAAPTAGLHFTEEFLSAIRQRRVQIGSVTLHVGAGTFAPVKTDRLEDHLMHEERFELSPSTAELIQAAKQGQKRVVAVGTTSLRVLESVAAQTGGPLVPTQGRTRLFLYPPFQFRIVDVLLTNFHLPRSTLLMLVCAFAAPGETRGRELILSAYAEAVRQGYRFYSYGDAMLIHS